MRFSGSSNSSRRSRARSRNPNSVPSRKEGFMAAFPGSRVTPDDPRYPTLISGFNQRWVGHPQYVEVVGDARQIVSVIQRCVDEGLRPTVRSGGHCYEGWVSLNDGVILDVSSMHAAGKDPETGWYFLESGCTNWDVYN